MRSEFYLIIPPSTMEDERRHQLAFNTSFPSLEDAKKARLQVAEQSKGWFKENSLYIAQRIL